jgi:hypothetical protein
LHEVTCPMPFQALVGQKNGLSKIIFSADRPIRFEPRRAPAQSARCDQTCCCENEIAEAADDPIVDVLRIVSAPMTNSARTRSIVCAAPHQRALRRADALRKKPFSSRGASRLDRLGNIAPRTSRAAKESCRKCMLYKHLQILDAVPPARRARRQRAPVGGTYWPSATRVAAPYVCGSSRRAHSFSCAAMARTALGLAHRDSPARDAAPRNDHDVIEREHAQRKTVIVSAIARRRSTAGTRRCAL